MKPNNSDTADNVLLRTLFQIPISSLDDYTYYYYYDPEDSENFERNVLYHFPFIGDQLMIGRFCALARGVNFIMNGANHKLDGVSTYPFQIFRQRLGKSSS